MYKNSKSKNQTNYSLVYVDRCGGGKGKIRVVINGGRSNAKEKCAKTLPLKYARDPLCVYGLRTFV